MTYQTTLARLADENREIVVLTAENRAAIRALPEALGDRFIDVGICEQTMIGAAAGLALRGRIPVCHALATFLVLRAFEFIRTDVGIPSLPVKLIGAVAGFLSEANGPTHQAVEDIALMRGVPTMQIYCPADEVELVDALPAIVASPAPVYVRYNASKPVPRMRAPFEMGKAEVLSEGNDVTILTYGFLLRECIDAKAALERRGVSVRLVNLRTLAPLDERTVLRAARETRLLVTVEDHFLRGGLATIVAELLMKHETSCRVLPLGLDAAWFKPALLEDVLAFEGFKGEQLAARITAAFRP